MSARSAIGMDECSGLQPSSPLKPDAGQESAEGGTVGTVVAAPRRVLGCEHETGPVMDGDRSLHEEAASWRALHAKELGGCSADRDRLVGSRDRRAWMLS